MGNTKYDAIWVPGSFFEKGYWKLTPRKQDDALGTLFALGLLIFILFLLILISPLIICIIGFSLVKRKRYYASIFAFLALIYLFIDYQKEWITSFMIFGTKQENFTNGILGIEYATHFFLINSIAFGIAIYFLVSSYFVNSKNSNEDFNYIENDKNLISAIIGVVFGLSSFFILKQSHIEFKSKVNKVVVDSTNINNAPVEASEDNYQSNYIDSTNIINDTLNSSETNDDKYTIGQELDGGVVFQLNDEQTHGLIFYDTKIPIDFDGAKRWCANNNYRLPNIDELILILNSNLISKTTNYFWSSDIASQEDINELSISCSRKIKKNGDSEAIETSSEFIKCSDYYFKKIYLFQSDCEASVNVIGIRSF